jgi:hypothetical protein
MTVKAMPTATSANAIFPTTAPSRVATWQPNGGEIKAADAELADTVGVSHHQAACPCHLPVWTWPSKDHRRCGGQRDRIAFDIVRNRAMKIVAALVKENQVIDTYTFEVASQENFAEVAKKAFAYFATGIHT